MINITHITIQPVVDALPMDLVTQIMVEFGSLTCANISTETVQIIIADEPFSHKQFEKMWAWFRRTDAAVEKYGACKTEAPPFDETEKWYRGNMLPVFSNFISRDDNPNTPYYLCVCRENGDEHLVRRSLPDDKLTEGKFMTLHCRFSEMPDCVPRNKLKTTRENAGNDGEYILSVIHTAGTAEDREKIRLILQEHDDDKFALI